MGIVTKQKGRSNRSHLIPRDGLHRRLESKGLPRPGAVGAHRERAAQKGASATRGHPHRVPSLIARIGFVNEPHALTRLRRLREPGPVSVKRMAIASNKRS